MDEMEGTLKPWRHLWESAHLEVAKGEAVFVCAPVCKACFCVCNNGLAMKLTMEQQNMASSDCAMYVNNSFLTCRILAMVH